MHLLLVDNRVKDVQTVTQSLLPGVDCVSVDFENDTYETLIAKIPVKMYESVGIFEENYELNTYQLIQSFPNSVLTNIQIEDPNLDTWSQYKSLVSYFKNTLQIKSLDLMGCNINSSPDWNYVIGYLGNQFQIKIHSSNDNTGSKDFGGNWILESGNVDLIGKYFSNNIEKYQFTLGQNSDLSYVITTDNKLYGAGINYSYALMDDTYIMETTNFISVPNVTNVSSLFGGPKSGSSFVINLDGSVYATGNNDFGQLGTGDTAGVSIFTKVYNPSLPANEGKQCTAVSCGSFHTQILLEDGSVYATGGNWDGQLGTGDTADCSVFTIAYNPINNQGKKCTAVSCGSDHTQILLEDGSVYATGSNWNGQLGTESSSGVFTIAYDQSLAENNGKKCIAVSCGAYHTQILLDDGSVYGTGANWNGQLGTGTKTECRVFTIAYNPINNQGKKCKAVSSSWGHTQILLEDGSVKATGSNSGGKLGTGNITYYSSFTTMLKSDGATMTNVSGLPEMYVPLAPPAAPAPTGLVATISGTTATINFNQPSNGSPAVTSYTYATSSNNITYSSFVNTNLIKVSATQVSISGLTTNSTYYFKLIANNGSPSIESNASNRIFVRPSTQQLIQQRESMTSMLNVGVTLQEMKDAGFTGNTPATATELLTSISFFAPPIIELSSNIVLPAKTVLSNTTTKPITLKNSGSTPVVITPSL